MPPLRLEAVSLPSDLAQERHLDAPAERLGLVRDLFQQQADAIAALAHRIDERFERAIEYLYTTSAHVIVSGMGKSGIIGQKIASTLASTGTPSFFVHPADALHGDLGMITEKNAIILISYSGETEEVVRLLPHLHHIRIPVIALVGRLDSTLARQADVALDVSVAREVCPNNLAPTSSTLAALAMGDALAVALMHERKFGPHDFARFHPGGSLGRLLCSRVSKAMQTESLPTARPETPVREALFTLARSKLDVLAVLDRDGKLVGVLDEADLRRVFDAGGDPLAVPVSMVMRREQPIIEQDARIADAKARSRSLQTHIMWAVNREGKIVGALDLRNV
ncbi:KpsF/GutQ family sugar-phosphate isomerase [Haliangium sp.]|uniref:KpsF/GutQ family sugar-phosphate isomerase n=1 Tax=Haliangium sp. TaxID=2663208 RepID=UPI003D0DEEBE